MLSAPLRDRFGNIYHLNFYEDNEIEKILARSSSLLNVDIHPSATAKIASRSRKTPRIANRILKRVRDFAQVKADGNVSEDITDQALTMLDIDTQGLDDIDRKVLEVIIHKFKGGPVGLNTIAAATGEDMATIEDVYEPFLIQIGFLQRTPKGRVATENAYHHLGIDNQKPPTLL